MSDPRRLAAPIPSFCDNGLDRMALRRDDPNWVEAQRRRSEARIVLMSEDRPLVLVQETHLTVRLPWSLAEDFGYRAEECALLGVDAAGPVFAALSGCPPEQLEAAGEGDAAVKAIDLRSLALQGACPPADLGLLAQARSLLHWHQTHQFCSRCGHRSQMSQAGYRRDCPSCGSQHFPRTDPVVIMLISDGDQCLMGRPPRLAENVFTTLAGFMEPGETIEQAVRREVLEESGIRVGAVHYAGSQPWPFPASLMLGCRGAALSREITMDATELEACRWFARDEVRAMLADTHPDGLRVPPPLSIAHWLIRGWAEDAG